jgi:hypothetical protein
MPLAPENSWRLTHEAVLEETAPQNSDRVSLNLKTLYSSAPSNSLIRPTIVKSGPICCKRLTIFYA